MTPLITISDALSRSEVESSSQITLAFSPRLQSETEAKYASILADILSDVQNVDNLTIGSLKHILATTTFVTDTKRWLTELTLPALVTVGKALTWELPNSNGVASVIVINVDILKGIQQGTSLHRGVLCHEIAHIADNEKRFAAQGADAHPDARDLSAVEHFIAASLWAEYFAERVASRHYSAEDLQTFAANSEIIRFLHVTFNRQREAYQNHAMQLLELWQLAIYATGQTADMIGRSLGEFHGGERSSCLASFKQDLSNQTWVAIVDEAEDILDRMFQLTSTWNVSPLLTIVRKMFNAIRIFPRPQGSGMYIDVP